MHLPVETGRLIWGRIIGGRVNWGRLIEGRIIKDALYVIMVIGQMPNNVRILGRYRKWIVVINTSN